MIFHSCAEAKDNVNIVHIFVQIQLNDEEWTSKVVLCVQYMNIDCRGRKPNLLSHEFAKISVQ